MDRFITNVAATADHVKAVRGSDKTINISFDEWNIWYNSRFENVDKIQGTDNWPRAPRLLEDVYSVSDGVVFGSLLITLLRHADRVTSASLAQLVNVIAPIMTEPGGPAWKQATFFPFAATAEHGRGVALDVSVVVDTYATGRFGDVPLVDAVATHDPAQKRLAIYLVNRATDSSTDLEIDLAAMHSANQRLTVSARVLADEDLDAANTREQPERVQLHPLPVETDGASLRLSMPAVSWAEMLIEY